MALPTPSAPPEPRRTTPQRGISALCAVAVELAGLLERETGLLRAMRLKEIGPLQADKLRLTQLCGTMLKTVDPAAPIAPPLREQWRAAGKKLGDAAIDNELALRIGRAATDKLVSAIIGYIERRRTPTSGYTRPKPMASGAARRPALAGVTVDRHL